MKYVASSAMALCVLGVYHVSGDEVVEEVPTELVEMEIEAKITEKMDKAQSLVFLPFLECDIEDGTEITDEKIESHITSCMQNHYSWQPVQSYPN